MIDLYKAIAILMGIDISTFSDGMISMLLNFAEKTVLVPLAKITREESLGCFGDSELWDFAIVLSVIYVQSQSNKRIAEKLNISDYTSFSRSLPTGESLSYSKNSNSPNAARPSITGFNQLDNLLFLFKECAYRPYEDHHIPLGIEDYNGQAEGILYEIYSDL